MCSVIYPLADCTRSSRVTESQSRPQTAEGAVARVEPSAAALPREFQRAFTPVERQQVIRVEFAEGETPLPLFTKVKLRSGIVLPHWIRWIW